MFQKKKENFLRFSYRLFIYWSEKTPTLYYEQATQQMDFISKHNLISLPIGVMGIFAELGKIKAIWNQYKDPRYSRDSVAQDIIQFEVSLNKTAKRYKIEKVK